MTKEIKDWKADIGEFFAQKGIYRIEYLNKNLRETVQEWVEYLKKFDRVTADYGLGDSKYGIPDLGSSVTAQIPGYFPFIILIGYTTNKNSNEVILTTKFTSRLKLRELTKSGARDDDKNNHIFSEEVTDGDHIYDSAFILWHLNNLLKNWLEQHNK